VLSHRSAGELRAIARAGPAIVITAPRSRGSRAEITVHRSRRLDRGERSVIDPIPITSLPRTIVDLAEVLDERRLCDAVHEAEIRRLFDLRAVYEALGRAPGRTGRYRLLRLLSNYADPPFPRSEAERNFLRPCERHGAQTEREALRGRLWG
jgi:hypothetical protein